MPTSLTSSCAATAIVCLAAFYSTAIHAQSKDLVRPTDSATASQVSGTPNSAGNESSAQQPKAATQSAADRAFDNKPAKGTREKCRRPQGGVDASGGENVNSSSKDNRACSGKSDKKSPQG